MIDDRPLIEQLIHIRWMLRRDMPAVTDIDWQCFEFPWTEQEFIDCLRNRNCIGMVAECDDRVCGFMIYELTKHRLRLLNFAVAPHFHRCGVGKLMALKLISKLNERRRRIEVVVRERNLTAQKFFASCGFRAVEVVQDAYENSDEAGYLFQYRFKEESPCSQ